MATIKTKFAVGLFVIIGFGIISVAVIWLGLSGTFETGQHYVAYFDESVQGLDKDSPVKYRGVSIGRVEHVGVAPDAALIQTTLKIESGLKPGLNIVAQLKSVGITGIMFVELDQKKKNEPNLSPPLTFPSKYPVIRTKPSEIKLIFDNINEVLEKLKLMDLAGISDKTKATLDSLNQKVDAAQIEELFSHVRSITLKLDQILASTEAFVTDSHQMVSRIDRLVENNQEKVSSAATHLDSAMKNADRLIGTSPKKRDLADTVARIHDAVAKAETLFGEGVGVIRETESSLALLQRSLLVSLRNLERATHNLNRSIDLIADQPSQLLFGEPPAARKIGNK